VICSNCGAQNPGGSRFCGGCGGSLSLSCPACGAPIEEGLRFCRECGASLGPPASAPTGTEAPAPAGPSAERRLVSILFADLVGFTTLSERRDSEDVRDLLTRYFDTSRQIIRRYGGTVEKFIGDAVMAVWGTPTAQEDDAERAVRAALDLTAAVTALGQEIGAPDLRARAGVLTGEAAVTIGAEGQGMVAGDLVNTASRIQSVASPGNVLVGESTRRASEASVVYEDAGTHELKGKAEPIPLWRAARVVAGRGGSLRSSGLEAPFVGRDRELRLVKELFHASAEERRANLVSVIGVAGIGKSWLSWEFEKYIVGLCDPVRWHRGRCLAYGEGVTYWALAEMVRMRAAIVEGEDAVSASAKLREAIETNVPDPEERRWVEPRLAHLLGLEERTATDKEDLFSAWRLFFERLAETSPTIMVFEDLQWADPSLLDFIEYVLEWSKSYPLYILTLARPELADRRPGWGAGRRNFTSLSLEPLPPQAMDDLLRGLVPGLPDELRGQILGRAEGVPLYAVETVRMLLDRGLVVQEGNEYRPTGAVEALEIPETLHALIAARLDSLIPGERLLVQNAAVLGKVFTKAGVAALMGLPEQDVDQLLMSLVRKEFLALQADPLSPERGQYGFLQDLVRQVAYETLARKDRKARHLAAAAYLESSWGGDEDEIVEVVGSHYLEAYQAAPDAPDASEIKGKARDRLARAGERAARLAANEEAQRYFEQAAELAEDSSIQAEMLERAGSMASAGGRADEATAHFERAIALFEAGGATHPAARVSARLADAMWNRGRLADAVERMDRSFQILVNEEPDEALASLASQLGRMLFFAGKSNLALERVESALEIAEALWVPEALSQALNTKAIILFARGRRKEGAALLRYALDVALENDIPSAALRAYYNLADISGNLDRYQEGREYVRSGLAMARRVGNRVWEWNFLGQLYSFCALGEWDEALAMAAEMPVEKLPEARSAFVCFLLHLPLIHSARGELDDARRHMELFSDAAASADVQERASFDTGRAVLLEAVGKHSDALEHARRSFDLRDSLGIGNECVKEGWILAVEAALSEGKSETAEEFLAALEGIPRGNLPQYVQAHAMRFRARLAIARGEPDRIEQRFKGAVGMFREMAVPFWMAVTLLEHGDWLVSEGRSTDAESLLAEAREIFERLKARPWLERLERTAAAATATIGAAREASS
jgi:class 3 adenylate cyclase/predicted ATPase